MGALIGTTISASITLIDELLCNTKIENGTVTTNVNWNAVLRSAVSGAITGAVAGSGAGIVAQRLVGGAMSALDSVSASISSRESVGKATVKAVAAGAIGAITAGKGMSNSKTQSLQAAAETAKQYVTRGNHPAVKRRALRAISVWKRYSSNMYKTAANETAMYGAFSWGVGKVIDYAAR